MCNTRIGTAIQGILGFYVFIGIVLTYFGVSIFPVKAELLAPFLIMVLAVAVMVNPFIALTKKFMKK
jgi:hypothetical protein